MALNKNNHEFVNNLLYVESFYDYLKQNVINYDIPHKSIPKRISP